MDVIEVESRLGQEDSEGECKTDWNAYGDMHSGNKHA